MSATLRRARLTWDTVIRLPPSQLAWRVLRTLQRRRPTPAARHPEPLVARPELGAEVRLWAPREATARRERVAALARGEFDFVGVSRRMVPPDWLGSPVSPLWTYNLHYFDYAVDLAWASALDDDAGARDTLARLVDDWMARTAGGRGPGWAPYPISARVTNWAKVLWIGESALPRPLRERMAASLHHQLHVLASRLEWDVRANHLQRNLTALAVGSLLFDGPVATRWRERALQWLDRELRTQVLVDGGHHERSPMYHAIALQDLLELQLVARASGLVLPATIEDAVARLASALGAFVRADGTLHAFNDSADGIALPFTELRRLAERAGVAMPVPDGAWSLPVAGYHGRRDAARGRALVVDAGPPGPREQPGHAHCDLLSFELDVGGLAIVVDSGVHGYDGDPFRAYARSTAAHNTVQVGQREQSECWGTFRLARRARSLAAEAGVEGDAWRFRGAFVSCGPRPWEHERTIHWVGDTLEVCDVVRRANGWARSYLHLHPECEVRVEGDAALVARGTVRLAITPFGAELDEVVRGLRDPVQGWYFPRFGVARPSPTLVFRVDQVTAGAFGYRIRIVEG